MKNVERKEKQNISVGNIKKKKKKIVGYIYASILIDKSRKGEEKL